MFKKSRISIATLVAAAMSSLYSCSKDDVQNVTPSARTTQDAKVGISTERAKALWNDFVSSIERGERKDPLGQYVSDGTWVENVEGQERPNRPKYDARLRRFKAVIQKSASGQATESYVTTQCEPTEIECPDPGTPGYPPPVTSVFASSEGVAPYSGSDNPNGYIYDLKIVKGGGSSQTPLDGYTVINLNLNKGAGGQYIYLTFTRNPSKVQYGRETDPDNAAGRTIVGPVRFIYSSANRTGAGFQSWPGTSVPIWAPGTFPGTWEQPDLNDGAGGRFIASYQSKDPQLGNPVEVGIIAGNSSSVTPPAGWIKLDYTRQNVDLNEGAGGDYIYYCIKSR